MFRRHSAQRQPPSGWEEGSDDRPGTIEKSGCERLLPKQSGGRCRSGGRWNDDGARERLLPQETEAGAAERRGCCAVITGGRSFLFCRKPGRRGTTERSSGEQDRRAGRRDQQTAVRACVRDLRSGKSEACLAFCAPICTTETAGQQRTAAAAERFRRRLR